MNEIVSFSRAAQWGLATAALLAAVAAGAQEKTREQVEAERATALATIAEANAKIAASNAETTKNVVAPLAGLAGTGKRELSDGAGKIEVALLGSTALAAASDLIARDVAASGRARNGILVLADDESVNMLASAQFDEETRQIERRFGRVADAAAEVCRVARRPARSGDSPRFANGGPGTPAPASALLAGGPFAILGAIGSLLQSDVSVAGVAYAPESRIVAGMVAQRLGPTALTPGTLSSPADTAISARLRDLDAAEQRASAGSAKCGGIAEATRSPGQKALIAEYLATGSALAALRTRLFTADADGRAPILDVLLARKLLTHQVLRVRVEDAGGSVITTKNILTAFGAPALSVTGGVVAGYVLSAPDTGAIAASGLYRCQSQARMLHSVHRNGGAKTACFRAEADPAGGQR